MCQEEGSGDGQVAATAESLGLSEFLGLLACGDDATQRVAALESVNRSIFEATEDEARMLFRSVLLMLNDPVWDVKRAAIRLLAELSPRFDLDTLHCLNRLLVYPDPLVPRRLIKPVRVYGLTHREYIAA